MEILKISGGVPLPETNIEPEHEWLEDDCFLSGLLAGANCSFPGVYFCPPNTQPITESLYQKVAWTSCSAILGGLNTA